MIKKIDPPVYLEFDDNSVLPSLFGVHDSNLKHLERSLGVRIQSRGNQMVIQGDSPQVQKAQTILKTLYQALKKGLPVGIRDIDKALESQESPLGPVSTPVSSKPEGTSRNQDEGVQESPVPDLTIATQKVVVTPRTSGQANYIKILKANDLVFSLGPAGSGKTYLAVAMGVSLLLTGRVDRMILTRPAVEAGEQLGFLPGDLREKVDPYLRPLYDALHDMIPPEQVERHIRRGDIEIAPLAFMRGRTLSNAFVILDEGQNTIQSQMRMFLTRMGTGTKMVITGDLTQVDLPKGTVSGLRHALQILEGTPGIGFYQLGHQDVVRHGLVKAIIQAYESHETIAY